MSKMYDFPIDDRHSVPIDIHEVEYLDDLFIDLLQQAPQGIKRRAFMDFLKEYPSNYASKDDEIMNKFLEDVLGTRTEAMSLPDREIDLIDASDDITAMPQPEKRLIYRGHFTPEHEDEKEFVDAAKEYSRLMYRQNELLKDRERGSEVFKALGLDPDKFHNSGKFNNADNAAAKAAGKIHIDDYLREHEADITPELLAKAVPDIKDPNNAFHMARSYMRKYIDNNNTDHSVAIKELRDKHPEVVLFNKHGGETPNADEELHPVIENWMLNRQNDAKYERSASKDWDAQYFDKWRKAWPEKMSQLDAVNRYAKMKNIDLMDYDEHPVITLLRDIEGDATIDAAKKHGLNPDDFFNEDGTVSDALCKDVYRPRHLISAIARRF